MDHDLEDHVSIAELVGDRAFLLGFLVPMILLGLAIVAPSLMVRFLELIWRQACLVCLFIPLAPC